MFNLNRILGIEFVGFSNEQLNIDEWFIFQLQLIWLFKRSKIYCKTQVFNCFQLRLHHFRLKLINSVVRVIWVIQEFWTEAFHILEHHHHHHHHLEFVVINYDYKKNLQHKRKQLFMVLIMVYYYYSKGFIVQLYYAILRIFIIYSQISLLKQISLQL